MRYLALILFSAATVAAADPRYDVKIRRTSYGIAHIEARDAGSLAYGDGYAQAEDHLCSIADQVVRVRGERAKYFGAGPGDVHLQSDVAMKALAIVEDAERILAKQPAEIQAIYAGFTAGYNRYLEEKGRDGVGGWCKGAEWVAPIRVADLAGYHRMLWLTLPSFAGPIASAAPPGAPRAAMQAAQWPEEAAGASNGWAIGRDLSASGRGMLLANPHYPWAGSNRFWEKHLRIPGKLDVYGVNLLGMPGVGIGFNRNVAWTHTVSAGKRFTVYRVSLVAGKPTVYKYGSEERAMTSRQVSVSVRQSDGSQKTVERTIWFTHYGPVLSLPPAPWTAQQAYTLRDANWENPGNNQHFAMGKAKGLDDLRKAHADYQEIPWLNTLAAGADGRVWYADTAATPKLSAAALEDWQKRRDTDMLTRGFWQQGGIVLLDGSDPKFEWVNDPAAKRPGIVPFSQSPQIERTDYVFNANDSYWLANVKAVIEGQYSALHGEPGTPRSLRTRNNALTLEGRTPDRAPGADGKFTVDEVGDALLRNRNLAAEMLRDELVARCRRKGSATVDGASVDLKTACEVLARWDARNDLTSRGAVLFREFIARYDATDLIRKGKLWAVDFDPREPATTPNTLAPGDLALENLARAVRLLESRSIALDAPLGELQYADKAGKRMPVHGGSGPYEGLMNMMMSARNLTTLEPAQYPAPVKGSRMLTEKGYPVGHGSSFVLVVEYTAKGPRGKAVLTYGESGDPRSPHFTDQTEMFGRKEWRPVLFEESDIRRDVKREMRLRTR